ncbi:MAG: DEAD/DEAH box helicase family protein [Rothia sp. (in: high G+C Gram-positive bacteria)]|nr:DEAD/DEAH box helicase family protein [Rothia sp. (in: high G+C Gram-positive bacteria)]
MPSTTFDDLLKYYREKSVSARNQGDHLEAFTQQYLVKEYLATDGVQAAQFEKVWLWKDWPERNNFADLGIDLVAQRYDGGLTAIQCKFYSQDHTMVKSDIDSFLSASSRKPFTERIVVATTDKWSKQAELMLKDQHIPVKLIGPNDFRNSNVNWDTYRSDAPENSLKTYEKKELRPHQHDAIKKTLEGFKTHDRGKLIMACGTGKTFTALRLAEKFVEQKGHARVLFMVPSLALMSQSVQEFSNETTTQMHAYAVCSDVKVGRRVTDDITDVQLHDLQIPATTDGKTLVEAMGRRVLDEGLTVVFSTYQSVDAVIEAQRAGLPDFDLIICDEAHRTTGVQLAGEQQSHFTKIHDNNLVRADKRLYMTATPRLFNDEAKNKAKESEAVLASMDDETFFGPIFYRIGFGEAVEKGLLTDYKVLVLGVDESQITSSFQSILADESNELNIDDVAKLIGCWNGLAKRRGGDQETSFGSDSAPMRRAVAFNKSIAASKSVAGEFEELVRVHLQNLKNQDSTDDLGVQVKHVDGSMNAQERGSLLNWLKEDVKTEVPQCRILSNARCLTEGVDVPNLDAVLFLNPRNSMVDVIQAVGRVMRKAEGKKYGYIILPIAIPEGASTSSALSDNKRYKVVWQVLQALRAHDERMDAAINQIELNDKNPESIIVETIDLNPVKGPATDIGSAGADEADSGSGSGQGTQLVLSFPAAEWKEGVYAKIVDKVGTREYWEDWSNDIASIATKHINLINSLLKNTDPALERVFADFLEGLQAMLNPAIDRAQAIEMLAQHLITKPVFDAMFAGHKFTEENPISMAMQEVISHLDSNASFERERKSLDAFYASVQRRVRGVDNAGAKQHIIKDLYDKFFQNAFPRVADRLGIVFTPVQVVDYILRSADEALLDAFGKRLTDEGVSIIEPFVGTGTFITRLLQLGLISPEDLQRKYKRELFANEIVLLSYYIAAINIETVYAETAQAAGLEVDYEPFEGMVLTDTFQLSESAGQLDVPVFKANSERAKRELEQDIQVVVMNPPYSAGQSSANDNNANDKYPVLDASIAQSYAKLSTATLKNSLYDSYIRAIRWASNRINGNGVVAFVSNGSFIDGNTADGIRKTFMDEFATIYVYNLRGNQRTSGETSRREGGKIFGSGSRTQVAICILVKKADHEGPAVLNYRDIGDYLSREEKLDIIENEGSIRGTDWEQIIPNEAGDWINQRDERYDSFQPIGDKATKGKPDTPGIFQNYSNGLKTNRDDWVYSFSKAQIINNTTRLFDTYINLLQENQDPYSATSAEISWSPGLLSQFKRKKEINRNEGRIQPSQYRPYCKQFVYFSAELNERRGQLPKLFPTPTHPNLGITLPGPGSAGEFYCLVADILPALGVATSLQTFTLYSYELLPEGELPLGADGEIIDGYVRHENITDSTLKSYQDFYEDSSITKEDIFYYIYALLHHPEYREQYRADLAKMLPRIPKVAGFSDFARIGRELADLHLRYEEVEPYAVQEKLSANVPEDEAKQYEYFSVKKMRFATKKDKSTIIFNQNITLSGIPREVYEYRLMGNKSAIEWIIDRYQVRLDKASQITNDPNDYSRELGNPRYILDLLKRIITVSLETQKLIATLPKLTITD